MDSQHVEGRVGDVRHAAGQGHDLGTVRHGEQRPDGGGGHPVGTGGVPVDVVVEPGVAAVQALQSGDRVPRRRDVGQLTAHAVGLRILVGHPPRVPHHGGRCRW